MFWDMTANTTVLEKVHFRKNTVKVLSLSSPGFKYVIGIFTVSFIFPIVKLWRGLVLIYLRVRLASLQWVVKLSLSPSVKWLCWHQVSVLVYAHRGLGGHSCVSRLPQRLSKCLSSSTWWQPTCELPLPATELQMKSAIEMQSLPKMYEPTRIRKCYLALQNAGSMKRNWDVLLNVILLGFLQASTEDSVIIHCFDSNIQISLNLLLSEFISTKL